MAALRRAPQAWVWHAELSAQRPRNASVNLQHMYEPVRSSVLAGLRSYVRGGHSWNVSARIVSDAALLQASFEQQTARRLLERKLRPLRAGDLFVWLGSGPVSKTGPVWPASADQAADWPRLAEARGSPAARSVPERGLRRASWPRSEPPCFPHSIVQLRRRRHLLLERARLVGSSR